MLSVALFSHSRYLCGAERMLLNLGLLLQRSKIARPVLVAPGEGEFASEVRRQGLACQFVPQAPWYLYRPGDMNGYRRGVTECSEALEQVLVDLNADAVVINTMTNLPPMLAAVALDIPSLLWVHGVIDSLLIPGRTSKFSAGHDELLLHGATRVIVLPNFTRDFCAQVMRRTELDVIPNWTQVDPQFVAPPDKYRSRRFACLNSFETFKGHATLLEAAALLKSENVAFGLDLYGDGEVRGDMERRTAALGLHDRVRFRGRTTEVNAVYDAALAVINPTQIDAFGMTLIEAMARKTPVVATRSGGPEDIVLDGQCGYLVDRDDAAALARRMQSLLDSPALAQRMGEEGFQRVLTHYNEAAAKTAFLPVIEQAIGGFRGYEPTVKALAKIYRLWMEQAQGPAGPGPSEPGPPPPAVSTISVRGVARLARSGLRRARAWGKRVLATVTANCVHWTTWVKQGWHGFRFAPVKNAAGTPFQVEIAAEHTPPKVVVGIRESDSLPARRREKTLDCMTWHAETAD